MHSASPAVTSMTPTDYVHMTGLPSHPRTLKRKNRQCLQIGSSLVWERKYKDPRLFKKHKYSAQTGQIGWTKKVSDYQK